MRTLTTPPVLRVLSLSLALSTAVACEQLIGADFDVRDASPPSTGASVGSGGADIDGGGDADASADGDAATPVPIALADDEDYPWGIAVDGDYVYWARSGHTEDGGPGLPNGAIMRVPRDGGTPKPIAKAQTVPNQLFVSNEYVYWTSSFGPGGSIQRAKKDGTAAPELIAGDADQPVGVIVDGSYVYWAGFKSVQRKLADGSGSAEIVSTDVLNGSFLAIDGDFVYWTNDNPTGAVRRTRITGTEPTTTLTEIESPNAFVMVSQVIYFDTFILGIGTVNRVSVASQNVPSTELASGQDAPAGIATDGKYLYWANSESGDVVRMSFGKGMPVQMAVDQKSPNGVAVDELNVYWTNFDAHGSVMKLAKTR